MACVKQFARPVFYDPEIRKQAYDMKDFTGLAEASAEELLASGDLRRIIDIIITEDLSNGLTPGGRSLNESDKEACEEENARLSQEETDCVAKLAKKKEHFLSVCKEVSKSVVAIHENASRACSETGMVQQQCRKAYDRGRLAPEAWWRGPDEEVKNPLPSDGIEFLEGETEQEFFIDASVIDNRQYTEVDYPLNVDVAHLLASELQRCENGEDNKFWNFHVTLNRAYPRNIYNCKEWTKKHYASTARNQDKRNDNRKEDAQDKEENNGNNEPPGNSNKPRTTKPSSDKKKPEARKP